MTFADKSGYDSTLQQVTHKGEEFAMDYIKIFQNAYALSISVVKFLPRISTDVHISG